MARHGAIAVATRLAEAVYRLFILEHRSKKAWLLEDRAVASPMSPEAAKAIADFLPADYAAKWWNAQVRRQVATDPSILEPRPT